MEKLRPTLAPVIREEREILELKIGRFSPLIGRLLAAGRAEDALLVALKQAVDENDRDAVFQIAQRLTSDIATKSPADAPL